MDLDEFSETCEQQVAVDPAWLGSDEHLTVTQPFVATRAPGTTVSWLEPGERSFAAGQTIALERPPEAGGASAETARSSPRSSSMKFFTDSGPTIAGRGGGPTLSVQWQLKRASISSVWHRTSSTGSSHKLAQARIALIRRTYLGDQELEVHPDVGEVLDEAQALIERASAGDETDDARRGALEVIRLIARRKQSLSTDLK